MKPGEIDRTTKHESVPFMDRVATPEGLVRELFELHALIRDQGLLEPGTDVSDRFSLLLGMAAGMIWRLNDEAHR